MIKRFSKKRAKENRKYLKLRNDFLEKNTECQAGLKGCTFFASQIHHKEGRTGDKLNDVSRWLPVCGNCHSIIENEPEMAKEKGYSRSRLSVVLANHDQEVKAIIIK